MQPSPVTMRRREGFHILSLCCKSRLPEPMATHEHPKCWQVVSGQPKYSRARNGRCKLGPKVQAKARENSMISYKASTLPPSKKIDHQLSQPQLHHPPLQHQNAPLALHNPLHGPMPLANLDHSLPNPRSDINRQLRSPSPTHSHLARP